MSKKLLDKYFIKHGDFYQISPKIRDNIIFSRHNLLSDPPFINMDIITCRNLLIYIEAEYQKSILMNFQFAMKFNSILFLGSSESLNSLQDNFSIVDSKWRIYSIRKSAKKLPYNLHFASTTVNKVKYETYPPSKKRVTQENQYAEYLSRIFSPKSIFIDDDYDIKYLNGDLNPYLKFPEGVIEYNLLKIADKSLVSVIQSGLRKVKESISITVIKDIPYKLSELDISITLSFRRYSNSNSNKDLYLITFEENKVDNKDTKIYSFTDFDEFSKQKIDDLEFRLDEKTQQFQKVREELEATNEELQASNEELLASNEELQSTNEELQSVNEELYTVNSELQDKNEELRVVNDEMNNFLNSTKLGILFIDSDMKIKKFNPEVKRLFKFSNHDIGRPLNHFALNIKDENYQILKEQVSDVISSLQESQKEIVFESGNIYIRRITPFITSRNVIDGVVITFIDITKLRETENKVKLGENKLLRLATIVKQSAHSIIYTDLDGNIEYANPAFEQTTDYKLEEIKGKPVNILKSGKHSNQFYKELWSTITSGKIWKGRFINKRKGGFEYLEETTIFPLKNTENEIIGFASIKQDITEQEQVDRKIHMSQNLEYLGVLAGGIAHDFNNLLTSILGGISLLKYEHKDSKNHEHLQILEETESAVNRAQGLSKQLLTFSKGGEPVKKIRNIVDVLKNTTKFILRGSNINLKFSITDDLWRLKFDEGQITQVIQNIIINSKEAMNNVGEIIISVSKFKASKNFIVENNVTANTLDFIKISIKDNGPGISFEDSLKIFNPYFTTKKTGNGLGLATSYSIIKKHHGTIIVNNEIKVGAEFSIYLPKEINIPNNENYAFEIDEIKKKYINVEIPHKTSVLCMDDELIIRETIRRILELFEIKVYLAKNGEEAIELYKQSLEEFTPIDIVVLDLTIVDGMGGVKTMEELLKLEPNIKAIVSSGYSEDIIITNYQEYGFKAVLPKPYTIEQVKEVIFSVLK
jgi:two-component system CheB/CheR fusion protein